MEYKKLYDKVYSSKPLYNNHSINEDRFIRTLRSIDLEKIDTALDLGCGKGTLYKALKDLNVKIDAADLNQYSDFPVIKIDITNEDEWQAINHYHMIFCLDVLEHIDREDLDVVIRNMSKKCDYAIVNTANHDDDPGEEQLHVTKEKLPFWVSLLDKYFLIYNVSNNCDIWYNFSLKSRKI